MTFSRFLFVVGLVVSIMIAKQADAAQEKAADDVKILFDGTSLDAWRGYAAEPVSKGWTIVDGTLHFDGSGGGDIVTKEEFGDFELTFDWKVTEGANSGVMYRVGLDEKAPYLTGPEYQILDDERHADGKSETTSAASLYALYAPNGKKLKPVGEWNSAKIVANGKRFEHWLNGKMVLDANIGGADWNKRVSESKFKEWKKFATLSTGRICLQDHGNKIWFRDIKVKVLEGTPEAKVSAIPQQK